MLPTDPLTLAIWPSIAFISIASSVKGVLRSILLYNLNSTCSIYTYLLGDMSAGSLAKAISKSGSSYQQDIQDHQYSSSIRAPKSSIVKYCRYSLL
jgi:hypothetical protein